MVRMQILNNVGKNYLLRSDQGINYQFYLDFEKTEDRPKKGDYIFWSPTNFTILEERCSPRTYGPVTSKKCVRKGDAVCERDFIVVVKETTIYLLQRYYG